jgi:peptide-methionine (S)-S-oxide reductase
MKTNLLFLIFVLMVGFSISGCSQTKKISTTPKAGNAIAIFAEGCFWCSEHIFESVVGIDEVISGYTAGTTKNPSYDDVSSHTTHHAEAILVNYNPKIISYDELVDVFFASHDPTTIDQQGPDRGDSYRSIAFYRDANEKKIIENKIKKLTATKTFKNKIVTEVKPITDFYEAENYHQDYIEHNPGNPYVKGVSIPRYNLFKKTYKGKLKSKS